MRSFRVAWTTAILCWPASTTVSFGVYSVCRTPLHVVTGTRRCEHITPALWQLHWLPVRQHIQYKLASLAFHALSGLTPDYLAGDCQLVANARRRSLQSAEWCVCTTPRQNSTFGDRSLAAASPRAWNELPFSLWRWAIPDYIQCTPEDILILRCLRPRRICDIYDLFAPHVLTYLLTLRKQ